MFDTIAENRIERAALSSPCQGLGGCDHARARAQRAEAEFVALPGRINAVKARMNEIANGVHQKEYKLLKEKQENLEKEIAKLNANIEQAKLKVDAWESNPKQQAQLEGLGWFGKRLWNKAFSCDTYTDREKNFTARALPLQKELSNLQGQLQSDEQRLSPDNLQVQRNAIATLEKEVAKSKDLLASYTQRITDARNSYQANKDAEKLALEREAQEAAAKEEAAKKAKEQGKQTQTLLLVGAALVGGYLLFRKSPTKVNA